MIMKSVFVCILCVFALLFFGTARYQTRATQTQHTTRSITSNGENSLGSARRRLSPNFMRSPRRSMPLIEHS